jgi:hypothetical protein
MNFAAGRRPDFLFTRWQAPFWRLYLRAEVPFQYRSEREDVAARFGDSFKGFVQAMGESGVHLVLVPVPTKIAIEREVIGGRLPAIDLVGEIPDAGSEDAAAVYRTVVEAAPAQTVDLLAVWQRYRASHPEAQLYPPASVNWSSLGMALGAQAVIAKLREQGVAVDVPDLRYENKNLPDLSSDAIHSLLLPAEFLRTAPEFQYYEPVYDLTEAVHGPDPTPRPRLILAGSCHSRHLYDGDFGFGSLLARSLHRTPLEVALANEPATAPLHQIADQGWILYPGDVLVWEFGMRNLPRVGEELPVLYVQKRARDLAGKRNR